MQITFFDMGFSGGGKVYDFVMIAFRAQFLADKELVNLGFISRRAFPTTAG